MEPHKFKDKQNQAHTRKAHSDTTLGSLATRYSPNKLLQCISFSHMHTLSLSKSSRFWLTSPCSHRAKQPQDREKQKNTQTNDKFMTSQTGQAEGSE